MLQAIQCLEEFEYPTAGALLLISFRLLHVDGFVGFQDRVEVGAVEIEAFDGPIVAVCSGEKESEGRKASNRCIRLIIIHSMDLCEAASD